MADSRAARLLREVVDCEPDNLPPYNEEEVRLVIEECHEHYALMRDIFSEMEAKGGGGDAAGPRPDADGENDPPAAGTPFAGDPAAAAAVVCHHAAILRSKRLLLTYLTARLDRVKALRWRRAVLPERVREGLSPSEARFFADYDRLLTSICSSDTGVGCDMTTADRPPAAAGEVMVRAVGAGGGDVAFSSGVFRLDPGSVHTLPRCEAEPLLREGVLVEVTAGAREQQEI